MSVTPPRESIASFSCFLVQKMSHNGTLDLYQDCLVFKYSGKEGGADCQIMFDAINEIVVETRLANAMTNLELQCKDQNYLFTGIHEAQDIKDLITIMRDHQKAPKLSYGFAHTGEKTVEWHDLPNPTLMTSAMLPANLATIVQQIEQKESFYAFYEASGNEDIILGDWIQRDGYRERLIQYNKWIVLPVLGKNKIAIKESQRLFESEGRAAINVISDLGETPFAKCFDPNVHIFFVEKGDEVEYMVKFQMMWSSEPFVKSIIQTKTTDEIRGQYTNFGQQLLRELGAEVAQDEAADEDASDSDFGRTRTIYKIVIIVLLVLLLGIVLLKHGRKYGMRPSWVSVVRLLTIGMFFALLIFF